MQREITSNKNVLVFLNIFVVDLYSYDLLLTNMEADSDDLDICRGAENFPIYFVCDGKRQQLNNKEVKRYLL